MTSPEGHRHSDVPRAPRQYHAQYSYQNYRSDGGGREEVARLSAQLMKTRDELEAERMKSANMRKTIAIENEKVMDAALSSMTTDLLNKQAKTLAHQAKVEAKERDLEYRQARIKQLEVYLSEGQKQVYHQYDEEVGGRTMSDVDREHERRQAELKAQRDVADLEGKLTTRLQHLQIREAAQQMREQQYKAMMRSSFETETKEKAMPDMEAKLNEVAEIEYNRGFGAGKVAGRVDAEEEARQKGFLEGYGTCHRAEVTLSKFRQGLIPRDSPELDFIFDPAHPHNIFTMGARIGGMNLEKEKKHIRNAVQQKESKVEKQSNQEQKKAEEAIHK